MSWVLELLGRGLPGSLFELFEHQLPRADGDHADELRDQLDLVRGSLDLQLRLGRALLEAHRLAEARRIFSGVIEREPACVAARLGLACVADEQGRNDEAIEQLQAAADTDRQDPALLVAIGLCHERSGQLAAARRAYTQALQRCAACDEAHHRLLAMALREGELEQARRWCQALVGHAPEAFDRLVALGVLELNCGQPEAALEALEQALMVEPGYCEGVFETAGPSARAEPIETLEQLVAKYPAVPEFHLQLADAYARDERGDEAIEHYRTALALKPDLLEATIKLGAQQLRRGQRTEAARSFLRAAVLNDRLMTMFAALSVCQRQLDRRDDARETLALLASLAPNTALLHGEALRLSLGGQVRSGAVRGSRRCGDVQLHEAMQRLKRAQPPAVPRPDVSYLVGLLWRQLGRPARAVQAQRRTLAQQPTFVAARIELVSLLYELGDEDEAEVHALKAVQWPADAVESHYTLALLFSQRSQFDLIVEQAELRDPMPPDVLRARLMMALAAVGLVDRAEATWRMLCELDPTPVDPIWSLVPQQV